MQQNVASFDVVSTPTPLGPWATAKKAWQLMAMVQGSTHAVLLQDDLIICKDFVLGLKAALAAVPDQIVSLYCPRKGALLAKEQGHSWVRITDGAYGPAIVIPTTKLRHFLQWNEQNIKPEVTHDDTRVCLYALAHDLDVWLTVPSLVDHAGASFSSIGHSNSQRVAKWFIGEENSALDVDWTAGVAETLLERGSLTLRSHAALFRNATAEDMAKLTGSLGSFKKRSKSNT